MRLALGVLLGLCCGCGSGVVQITALTATQRADDHVTVSVSLRCDAFSCFEVASDPTTCVTISWVKGPHKGGAEEPLEKQRHCLPVLQYTDVGEVTTLSLDPLPRDPMHVDAMTNDFKTAPVTQ